MEMMKDIHMAIGAEGNPQDWSAGKRLHTARSRNDQVAVDFRLYVQRSNREIVNLLIKLIETGEDIADSSIGDYCYQG